MSFVVKAFAFPLCTFVSFVVLAVGFSLCLCASVVTAFLYHFREYLFAYSGATCPTISLGSSIGAPATIRSGITPAHVGNA
ncbi:exported hypothetical protein [Candidatus Sulfotelmatobacter sp. SbA7]|nr:exported hypothetical protein [Candidatus Sulfotelmatobacter sp. SbA7]